MKKLYKFEWDIRRMGTVEGIFIAEESEVKEAIGKKVYFGEILGKHSEVYGDIGEDDIQVVSEDQDFISKCEEIFGTSISGYNPLSYMNEDEW
jgi:hypothetical protein